MVDSIKRKPIGYKRKPIGYTKFVAGAVLQFPQLSRLVFVIGFGIALSVANPILVGQLLGQETEPSSDPQSALAEHELKTIVKAAFQENRDGYSSDEVILNDTLFAAFTNACQSAAPDTGVAEFGWTLINLRKAGKLSDLPATQRRSTDVTSVLHVAEIASRTMVDTHALSIDRIMVDPELRSEFDELARGVIAEVDLYQVRKAAFRLRKTRRLRPELITRIADWGRKIESHEADAIAADPSIVPADSGIYIFRDQTGYLYIGESNNLRRRLTQHLDESSSESLANYLTENGADEITIELHLFDPDSRINEVAVRRAYESELISSRNPKFNLSAK